MPPRESNKISAGRASDFKQAQQVIEKKAPGTQTAAPSLKAKPLKEALFPSSTSNRTPRSPKPMDLTPQPGPGPKFVSDSFKDAKGNPYVFNPGGAAYNAVKGVTDIGGRAVDDVANLASLGKNNSEDWDGSRGNSFAQSAANIAGIAAVALTGKVGGGAVKDPAIVAGNKIAKPINTATTIPSRSSRKEKSVYPASFLPESEATNYLSPKKIDRTTGFYHGSANATPGPLTPRGPQKQNLLTGDAFFTDTPSVAKGYTGGSTEGLANPQTWDKVYKAEGLQDKKILDLYPQGPTLAQQDPKLFKRMLKDIKAGAYPEDSVGVGDPRWTERRDPEDGSLLGYEYNGKKPYSQQQANDWVTHLKTTEGGFGRARHRAVTNRNNNSYSYPRPNSGRFTMLNDINEKTGNVVANSALARGWDGFTHEGGKHGGPETHQVTALWDANNTSIAKIPDADTALPAVKPIREVEAPGAWKPSGVSQQFSKMFAPKVKVLDRLGFDV